VLQCKDRATLCGSAVNTISYSTQWLCHIDYGKAKGIVRTTLVSGDLLRESVKALVDGGCLDVAGSTERTLEHANANDGR